MQYLCYDGRRTSAELETYFIRILNKKLNGARTFMPSPEDSYLVVVT